MRVPIRWHAEARRLRADGQTPVEIAKTLNRPLSTVRWVLDEHDERRQTADRVVRNRAQPRVRTPTHVARVILDPDTLKAAAFAFANHEIDREELLRRITR